MKIFRKLAVEHAKDIEGDLRAPRNRSRLDAKAASF
jgi:hypothetical protein